LKGYSIIYMVLFVACKHAVNNADTVIAAPLKIPTISVSSTDSLLQLKNGVWYYGQHLFCGSINTYYSSGKLRSQLSVYNGKEEGMTNSFYENGNKEACRYYHAGEKDSVHRGWWLNGQPRFEYHFRKGEYDGDFKEWYASGKPYKHIIYASGKEQRGKGWRENGKLYMNFVMREGRLYGLMNPNLCYSLKNEKGEYINSLK